MMCGIFVNVRLKNYLVLGIMGSVIIYFLSGDVMFIFDVVMCYKEEGILVIVIGGKEYGIGLSWDWVVKGFFLMGVKVVFVESYEWIYCLNFIGMGILFF